MKRSCVYSWSRLRALVAAAAVAVLLPGVSGQSPRASDRERAPEATRVVVGPLSLDMPTDWRRREGPADDNPHFDAPTETAGLGPTVAISAEEARQDAMAPGMTELSREWRDINGRRLQVRHWTSEEDGTRGITIVFDSIEPGKLFQIMGWMPATQWTTRAAEVWRVIGTLNVSGAGDATGRNVVDGRFGPVRRYDFGNKLAVTNGPSAFYFLKFDKPVLLRSIRTYHWNNGRGATPGTIALHDAKGAMLGPWPAQGAPGQGGVADAYWQATPGILLLPGTYSIVTSSNRTWSTNREAGGRGFFTVEWQEALASTTPGNTADTGHKGGASDATGGGASQNKSAGATGDGVLFAGDLGQRWSKLSVAGGDFDKFARHANGMLAVSVPAGSGWGKTGIRSSEPLITLPSATANFATRFEVTVDGARSDNFVISLVPASKQSADEWSGHQVRVGVVRPDGGPPVLVLWIGQQEAGRHQLPATSINHITLEVRPDGAVLVSDEGGKTLLQGIAPEEIDRGGYHVFALAHDGPGGQSVDP